jgi:hypothetical protein
MATSFVPTLILPCYGGDITVPIAASALQWRNHSPNITGIGSWHWWRHYCSYSLILLGQGTVETSNIVISPGLGGNILVPCLMLLYRVLGPT